MPANQVNLIQRALQTLLTWWIWAITLLGPCQTIHTVLFIFLQDIPCTLGFFLVSPGGAVPFRCGSPGKTASSTCLSLAESCSLLTASSWADFRARTQPLYAERFAVSWNWYSQRLEQKCKLSDQVMWKKRRKKKLLQVCPTVCTLSDLVGILD